MAHVSVNFDPSYQRLTFHTLNVIRGGKVLGRLRNTRIQVLPRETELEYLIDDGSMTASAMLDDVRIGDIVEYAYSIAGSNPVFRNHAAGMLSLAWSVPLERAYIRLLMPAARRPGSRAARTGGAHRCRTQRSGRSCGGGLAAGAARNPVSRYLGIEVGAGSHAPSAPALVYQRRFGDGKDKALLMVALLEALGVEAAPALVDTDVTSGVARLAPTPHAFNHVLVRVTVAGKTYWLDPTRVLQAGDLAHLFQPDYGQALVLADGTTNLVAMAQPDAMRSKRVASVFDLRGGFGGAVTYTVNTTLRGAAADSMRANLASNRAQMARQYVDYYGRSYPGLVAAGELDVQDEPERNTLTCHRHLEQGEKAARSRYRILRYRGFADSARGGQPRHAAENRVPV